MGAILARRVEFIGLELQVLKKESLKWWHKALYLLIIAAVFYVIKWPTATILDWLGAAFLMLVVINYNAIQSWLLGDKPD